MTVTALVKALDFLEAPKRLFADIGVGKKKPDVRAGVTCAAGLENVATKADVAELTRVIKHSIARLEVCVILGLVAFTGILSIVAW